MKKKLFAGALALLMLLGCVTVGLAGSQSDPLISRNYLNGTFFLELEAYVVQRVAQSTQDLQVGVGETFEDGWTTSSGFVSGAGEYGDTVTLTTGSGLIWTAGSGAVSSGVLVDVTAGSEIDEGKALTAGHRYLAGADTMVVASSQAQWMAEGKWLLGTGGTVIAPLPFTDVPADEWYAAAASWGAAQGYVLGHGDGTFAPDDDCTHIQIITFLWRAAGRQSAPQAPIAMDPNVPEFQSAANWAYDKGLITSSFDPEAPCTRADAVTYIWQAFGSESATVSSFTDVPAGADYAKAVDWAVANGITAGDEDGTVFSPDKICTRGHIVTFLHRAYVPEVRV